MFGIDSFHIQTAGNILLIAFLAVFAALYAVFIYRNSLPRLSRGQRYLLNAVRIIALVAILFISAEPIISLGKTVTVKPIHLVFIDNSLSMSADSAGISKPAAVRRFIEKLTNNTFIGEVRFFTFGKDITALPGERVSPSALSFNEPVTNFEHIFASIKKNNLAPASVSIISDGVITDGQNPLSGAEQLGVPTLSVGVGDTTAKKDIAITDITTNEILYPGASTPVRITVQNSRFGNVPCKIQLYEESKLIETKAVDLIEGTNTVKFDYIPGSPGEKRLKVYLPPLSGETNTHNNAKSTFVKVLQNKRKAVIVAGYPSPDVTFLRQSLLSDTNIAVYSVIEIGPNKTLSPINWKTVDSADVILFLHYPVTSSSPQLFDEFKKQITVKQKPLFALIDENASLPMIRQIEEFLPVKSGRAMQGTALAQPILFEKNSGHPLFTNAGLTTARDWENFAPINRQNTEFNIKPEGSLLLAARLNTIATTIPLLAARNIGSQRSIAFIGKDIWRWKLTSEAAQGARFDAFIVNAFKWLFAANQKENFILRTDKKFYALNESVEFSAELYDENSAPVADAQIGVSIQNGGNKASLLLNSLGNGLYEGKFTPQQMGDFSYVGTAQSKTVAEARKSGRFNVGENQAELSDLRSDYQFLFSLSTITKGKFFPSDSLNTYIVWLNKLDKKMISHHREFHEIVLWNNPWSLAILILLFSFEWFMRKRAGML